MNDLAQRHAIDVQLLSIKCGALYGALAFAGLIALGLVTGEHQVSLLAIVGAFFAYQNFSLVASNARDFYINAAMVFSIAAGAAAAALAVL